MKQIKKTRGLLRAARAAEDGDGGRNDDQYGAEGDSEFVRYLDSSPVYS